LSEIDRIFVLEVSAMLVRKGKRRQLAAFGCDQTLRLIKVVPRNSLRLSRI